MEGNSKFPEASAPTHANHPGSRPSIRVSKAHLQPRRKEGSSTRRQGPRLEGVSFRAVYSGGKWGGKEGSGAEEIGGSKLKRAVVAFCLRFDEVGGELPCVVGEILDRCPGIVSCRGFRK